MSCIFVPLEATVSHYNAKVLEIVTLNCFVFLIIIELDDYSYGMILLDKGIWRQ